MKFIKLEARDKNGQLLGTDDHFPIAESIEDILEMENLDNGWSAEEIVACFNGGSRVKRQAQLRGESSEPTPLKAFKKLSKAEQEKAMAKYLAEREKTA